MHTDKGEHIKLKSCTAIETINKVKKQPMIKRKYLQTMCKRLILKPATQKKIQLHPQKNSTKN
jgi:hypothetical protein